MQCLLLCMLTCIALLGTRLDRKLASILSDAWSFECISGYERLIGIDFLVSSGLLSASASASAFLLCVGR